MDDTSVVVGEIIEWTEAHTQIWSEAGKAHVTMTTAMRTFVCRLGGTGDGRMSSLVVVCSRMPSTASAQLDSKAKLL